LRRIRRDQAGFARASRQRTRLTLDSAWLKELFEPFGEISVRRMFGGAGLYRDGIMFGLVSDGDIYLKADDSIADRFREAGSRPFVYRKGKKPVTMSYWSLPEAALDDSDLLKEWAQLSFEAAMRAKPPGKR
jgi:DNA transformation protein and related proteins